MSFDPLRTWKYADSEDNLGREASAAVTQILSNSMSHDGI